LAQTQTLRSIEGEGDALIFRKANLHVFVVTL